MSQDDRPRLLVGLLGLPAEDRERLSYVEIHAGNPRTVHCHFHQDVLPAISGELAADPSISDQIAEVRQAGILGTGIDVARRDGVFLLKLWNGPYERAAWERRMDIAVTHPAALEVLAAAGKVKAQPALAMLAEEALARASASASPTLPVEALEELAQKGAQRVQTAASGTTDVVRMPMGHSRPCVICAKDARHTIGQAPIHQGECLQLYFDGTAQQQPAVPLVEAPQEEPPSSPEHPGSSAAEPQYAAESPPEPPNVPDAPAPTKSPEPTTAPLTVPAAAPAVVLDVDVVGLPDGTEAEHPFVIDTFDKVFALARHYELGVQVTKTHTEAGQVWITAAMLTKLGIAVPSPGKKMLTEFRESTKGSPALVQAVQAGWDMVGRADDGPSLGRWTWARNGPHSVLLAVIPLMTDLSAQPLLEGDPSPGTLARRLALFAGGYRHPFKMSAQTSVFDYVRTLRWKERAAVTEPQRDLIHEQAELDGNFSRVPTDEERQMLYLHGYDRGGSYLAGLSSKGHFGIGQPVHIEGPVTLDRTTYGLVRIAQLPEVGDWRAPHPLVANPGYRPNGAFWRHTTTVRWAQELGYEPEILEAWIWPRTMPIFSTWYERVRDARELFQRLQDLGDPDARLAKEQLKAAYTRMIGQMASVDSQGQQWYAPDRRWGIVAQSRVNIERLIHTIGAATADQRSGLGVWPVAWDNDTVVYASNDPNPQTAWPGEAKRLGTGIGQMRWEGSAMLQDHLEYLTGDKWLGKDHLTKDWPHGGESA